MEQNESQNSVTIVTVTYNSLEVLPNMLSSINEGVPIIIIDNCSEDIKSLRALSKKHKADLIESKSNLGFGSACNLGALKSKTEYILFLNPDTLLNSNAIQALLKASCKYPKAAAMNPKILNGDNSIYLKRRSHLLPRSKWLKRNLKRDTKVNILSGSALFVKKEFFEKAQGFDENIFLFHEDDDLSIRLNNEYGPLIYINDSIVKHYTGTSSIRSNKNTAFKAWHMGQSKIYTIKKHQITFGKTLAVFHSFVKIFSPENLLSKRRFIKNYSFLKSILYACIFKKK